MKDLRSVYPDGRPKSSGGNPIACRGLSSYETTKNPCSSQGFSKLFVEMGGVEPPSEEKTTQVTTYIVCLLHLARPHPTDRTLDVQPHVVPLNMLDGLHKMSMRRTSRYPARGRRLFGARQAKLLETGRLRFS